MSQQALTSLHWRQASSTLCRYIGIQEKEFEWLTEQLVSLANKYCKGRIVSALEGGYRIQGGIVSAFARSVASHVRALSAPTQAHWSWADVQAEQQRERQRKVLLLCCHRFSIVGWINMRLDAFVDLMKER